MLRQMIETEVNLWKMNISSVGGRLALINAGLTQGKIRSGQNWLLISLLCGPLATLFIVVWNKLEK